MKLLVWVIDAVIHFNDSPMFKFSNYAEKKPAVANTVYKIEIIYIVI